MNYIFKTDRLILRPFTESDVENLFSLYSNEEVAKNLLRLPSPFTLESAGQMIKDAEIDLQNEKSFNFCIESKTTKDFIGIVTLRIPSNGINLNERERNRNQGLGILGYSIVRSEWGKGYATEAAKRLIEFAISEKRITILQASPIEENIASARILQKLGFNLVKEGIMETPLYGGNPKKVCRYIYEVK